MDESNGDHPLLSATEIARDESGKWHHIFNKKISSVTYRIDHRLDLVDDLAVVSEYVDNFFEDILNKEIQRMHISENGFYSCLIESESIDHPLYVPPHRINNRHPEDILNVFRKVAQSDIQIKLDKQFTIMWTFAQPPQGTGKYSWVSPKTPYERSHEKRSVVMITNSDQSCFFRALAVAKFHAIKPINRKLWSVEDTREWKQITRSEDFQKSKAKLLSDACGFELDVPIRFADYSPIQETFKDDFRIIIFNAVERSKVFVGNSESKNHCFLELFQGGDGGHYNTVVKPRAYFGWKDFCFKCFVPIRKRHLCPQACIFCREPPACIQEEIKLCDQCFSVFVSDTCFENHKKNKTCDQFKKCPICKRLEISPHNCFEYTCKDCYEKYTETPHYCYIKNLDMDKLRKEDEQNKLIVCFDIEATQTYQVNERLYHKPNLLICMGACNECLGQTYCRFCCNEKIFTGEDCVKEFCSYLYGDLSKKAEKNNLKIYVYGHHSSGYDSQFILRDLSERGFSNQDLDIIARGLKILKLRVGNISFLDSLCFFQCKLDQLTSAFNLQIDANLKKLKFPHKYNTSENWNNNPSIIPPIEYFNLEYMSKDDAQETICWYEERKKTPWNFREELVKYCRVDVQILKESILKFQSVFKEISGLDPLTRNFTLAGISLEFFRAKCLRPKILAKTPVAGYMPSRNQSPEGRVFIDWIQSFLQRKLIREYKSGIVFADGFDPVTNTVYEFMGCYIHGHCEFRNESKQADVEKKKEYYQRLGFNTVFMYSCEFRSMIDASQDYYKRRLLYHKKIKKIGPIAIRDALYGGRTNNLKFVKNCDENEEICYVDVCSLYPYVLKYREFPINHPVLIEENFQDVSSYFGFIKCSIIPPGNLYLPVLPVRSGGKLVFPLCNTCCKMMNQKSCRHSDSQRAILGTWTTIEVIEAIRSGYVIKEIFQILHYEQRDGSLFKSFIDTWLKVKVESSEYPSWVTTEDDKDRFVLNYKEKEGIELDKTNIGLNKVKRFIAKLILNSLWGRLSMRTNLTKTKLITECQEYFELLQDETISIQSEVDLSDNMIKMSWKSIEEDDNNVKSINVAVGSYVTSWARLHLLKIMRNIENIRLGSLLYFDTDSCIYYRRLNDPPVEGMGDFLGDLCDELKGKVCKKFVSLGPKCYAYQPIGEDVVLKFKGIRLNLKALDVLKFETLVNMAIKRMNNERMPIFIPQFNIQSDKFHAVYSRFFNKKLESTSTKRAIDAQTTRPFGYKNDDQV